MVYTQGIYVWPKGLGPFFNRIGLFRGYGEDGQQLTTSSRIDAFLGGNGASCFGGCAVPKDKAVVF